MSSRPSFLKNLTIYWIAVAVLAVWFLFIHSPPYLLRRQIWKDPAFSFHLIGAYGLYLVCLWNTLFTPSALNKKTAWHTRTGKVGMALGYFGFVSGMYLSFWPYRELPPRSFAISITAGGIAQVILQTLGMRAIQRYHRIKEQIEENTSTFGEPSILQTLEEEKQKALRLHIRYMVSLLVVACGAPALLRLVDAISIPGLKLGSTAMVPLAFVILFFVARGMQSTYIRPNTNKDNTTVEETPLLQSSMGITTTTDA